MASSPLSRWKKQHAAAETALAAVLKEYFADQLERLLAAMGNAVAPSVVALTFNAADEQKRLQAVAGLLLVGFMAEGAADVWKQYGKVKAKRAAKFKTKAAADPAGEDEIDPRLMAYELPDDVKTAIKQQWATLAKEPYWAEIQTATSETITDLLTAGIKEGLSGRELVKSLKESFAGISDFRAKAIARTEVTAAFNSGHDASYETLKANGEDFEVEWLAVVDDDTRSTHVEMNGKTIKPGESFSVGGHAAKFPGDASLPAKQRVNCRCTTATKWPDAA